MRWRARKLADVAEIDRFVAVAECVPEVVRKGDRKSVDEVVLVVADGGSRECRGMQMSKYQNTRVVSGEVQRGWRVPRSRQRWGVGGEAWVRRRWMRSKGECRRSLHCWHPDEQE